MEGDVMIRDVMTREYVGVSESDSVLGAVKLMRTEEAGSVVVLRGTEPVGILTEWDVLGVVADEHDPDDVVVSAVMSTPVLTMDASRSLADAAGTMSNQNIRRLLVTDESDELAGVLTERDVIAAASASMTGVPTEPETRLEVNDERAVDIDGGEPEFATQGICEVCGSLTRSLANFNGQIICADCREV